MLILSRKRNEKIKIGDDTEITVVDIRGDQVQIGIDAPRSVPVHRHEIYEEIKAGEKSPRKKK
jgi:carbon storage regulator